MDGLKLASRSLVAAAKFFFWTLVEVSTQAIYWHKEAARELLVLTPRRPKDLYDNGYALFAFDISIDGWVGHWRKPGQVPGTPAAETYAWLEAWDGIPFHEVEFSDMPHITFKVRAVALDWCRENLTGEDIQAALAGATAAREKAKSTAEGRMASKAIAEAQEQAKAATKQ